MIFPFAQVMVFNFPVDFGVTGTEGAEDGVGVGAKDGVGVGVLAATSFKAA